MGMFMSFEATCPLDGTVFEYRSTPSYTIMGRRLDGCPFGSWRFPVEIPRCPTCRFPAMDRLVTDETKDLAREMAASENYAAAMAEADYHALAFVMDRLSISTPLARLDKRLQACWEVGPTDPRYGRYVQELGERLDAMAETLRAEDPETWMMLESFVANLQRQAGDFAGAVRRLDNLDASGRAERIEDLLNQTRALIADGDRSLQHGGDEERPRSKGGFLSRRRILEIPPEETN